MQTLILSLALVTSSLVTMVHADNAVQRFGGGTGPYSLFIDTNLFGRLSLTSSNFGIGGSVVISATPVANPTSNGTPATLTAITIPGGTLANNGDTLTLQARGIMAVGSITPGTNQFQIIFGSQTLLDSGLQSASNTTYTLEATITRTGDTSQHVNGRLDWGAVVVPFAFTNVDLEISQTNSIDTVLRVASTGRVQGSHTNTFTRLIWAPTGK
jgi:hypothetical protein